MESRLDGRTVALSAAGAQGQVVLRPRSACNGVKVFSATRFAERQVLGEQVTEWLQSNPWCEPTEFVVTQSSDASFHCLTITVFYREIAS